MLDLINYYLLLMKKNFNLLLDAYPLQRSSRVGHLRLYGAT